MLRTALIVQVGERLICLYYTGRRHAGENLERLLTQREPGRDKPLVMSDALSSNNAEEAGLIRCHCLAHGRRKFTELADDISSRFRALVGRSPTEYRTAAVEAGAVPAIPGCVVMMWTRPHGEVPQARRSEPPNTDPRLVETQPKEVR